MVNDPFKAENTLEKHAGDLDLSFDSMHHTIGHGSTQAAAGNHKHAASDLPAPPTVITDHGALSGIYPDDDHPQYPLTNGARAGGTWAINITGDANTVDGHSFEWNDRGAMASYYWAANAPGDTFLVSLGSFDARYAPRGGGGARTGSQVITTNGAGEGTITPGAWVGAPVICNGDFPAHSRAASIKSYDGVNIVITNCDPNKTLRVNWVVGL